MASQRAATAWQGWLLVSCGWLAVMASAMLSPVLPRMTAHFQQQPRVDLLISLVASLPALFVALLAWPFGILGDRVGHKRVLFWATVVYGAFGTAPVWLTTLPQIVASRGLVGIAEAAIMTCSTTLIGDYFGAERRGRYLALQTGTAPLMAMTVIALGGALGDSNWRNPFLAYGFAFALAPLTGLLLWEPRRASATTEAGAPQGAQGPPAFRWRKLLLICAVTLFAMTAFLITVIQTGFVLTERGLSSPAKIGLWQGIASLANPLGALTFGLVRSRPLPKVAWCLLLLSTGFFVIALLPSWQSAVVGAVIANYGAGMILPTLVTWAITTLPAAQRGTGTGLWMAASFLGQFLSPLIVLGLRHLTGSLSGAILVYAAACAVSALSASACLVAAARANTVPPT
ncbi:MAG TPA: MFS transporter [Steroidobacteraceae bacterium]|nr:MFS transporter [Steroidobacteraceae bacterium]